MNIAQDYEVTTVDYATNLKNTETVSASEVLHDEHFVTFKRGPKVVAMFLKHTVMKVKLI